MKTRIPKRVYTEQFRDAAVRQVIEASRSVIEVARSLEISEKTLGNWVRQVRRGSPRSSKQRRCRSRRRRQSLLGCARRTRG